MAKNGMEIILFHFTQTAKGQIAEAEALAEKFRVECDNVKTYTAELEIENRR